MIDEITMHYFILLLLILVFHLYVEKWLTVLDGESCVSTANDRNTKTSP